MASRLVNVRLDGVRLDKVRQLRERGIALADIVREAVDERYATVGGSDTPVEEVIQGIFARYPDPPRLAPRNYDVHDRHAARAAILGRHRKRRGPR